MPMDKAPGPDDFTGRFYKCCWGIIGEDVAKFSVHHSDSEKGRSIQDNFLLVQQLVRFLHRSKQPHVLLKLDMTKAFGSVSWSFLLEILQHLGFGRKWCNLISLLLSTSSTQVLINGQPGQNIFHLRGLRQGDPLSLMLFILVMDVLNSLVAEASQRNLLQPILVSHNPHRVSLYADDVVLFVRPSSCDLRMVKELLECFGHVSSLRCNLSKSAATPIQCSEEDIALVSAELSCAVGSFRCTYYLGLPLTLHKPPKFVLLPLVDKVADKLPGRKAPLLNRAGRLVVVISVLTTTLIHLLTALDLPKWMIRAIDKLRRGFLSRASPRGKLSCRPLRFGGLGILDLELLGWALRVRWLWFQKTDSTRPWTGLQVMVPKKASALFAAAVDTIVQGKTLAELAPNLLSTIPKKAVQRRTVSQALANRRWVSDIKGALTVQVLSEYLLVWYLVDGVELQPDTPDQHHWKLSSSGTYSCKSAYDSLFTGTISFSPWKRIWKSWAPMNRRFFIWLAINNKCWTSDRLAKRGLPHQFVCPFCDQAEETINHILAGCVLSREVWAWILRELRLDMIPPPHASSRFCSRWSRAAATIDKNLKRGFNSLVILVAWMLWKHRNACVFDGAQPQVQAVISQVASEGHLWCLAGYAGLRELLLRSMQLLPLVAT
ncbi:hypothetical protein U9M48_041977 [Paspalum notatum var. saurae]|uniref:Reverse transcriptase domain-containing protein n=1 Tax=Paspalum notatum var. saurae TaxID=547442 RepID=A0AAQ3UTU0_PASNO